MLTRCWQQDNTIDEHGGYEDLALEIMPIYLRHRLDWADHTNMLIVTTPEKPNRV